MFANVNWETNENSVVIIYLQSRGGGLNSSLGEEVVLNMYLIYPVKCYFVFMSKPLT